MIFQLFFKKLRANQSAMKESSVKYFYYLYFCSSKNDQIYGMSIVKFGLETGVEVIKSDIEKVLNTLTFKIFVED
jgi:hypothetical protein